MSFLSDLFHGNVGNLGHDLNPSNIFSDAGADTTKALKNPLVDAGLLVGGGLLTAGLLDPALLGLEGAGIATDVAAGGGLDAAAGGGLDAALGFAGDARATDAAAGGVATDAFGFLDPAAAGTAAGGGGSPAGDASMFANLPNISNVADPALASGNIYGSAGGGGGFWSDLISGAEKSVTKNPLGIAAAAGGLGLSFLRGNQTDPNQKALQGEAPALQAQGAALTASGQQLQTYLTNGTLPPALQSQVTSAVQAEKARIISNHAANGENTNPTQNSALAQELSQADINGLNLAGQLEQQLFTSGTQLINTGLNETGLSTQLYEVLARMDQQDNKQLMQAIASMAAALGGGGAKIQIGGNAATT